MKKFLLLLFLSAFLAGVGAAQTTPFNQAFGERFRPGPDNRPPLPHFGQEITHRWNLIAINATGLDHTPVGPGEARVFGEQLGPGRASRAMAIVHIAIFDAVNAIVGQYQSYTGLSRFRPRCSMEAAVAQAAHDTLVALYPSQQASFDARLAEDLSAIRNSALRDAGIALGRRAAAAILALRSGDGAEVPEPLMGTGWIPSLEPGHWRQDPVSQVPIALGAHWGACRPFVVESPSQFRAPPPPALTSAEYTRDYNETKRLGGDGITTPTERTAEQTFIGTFWAYDGTPSLCAPPRLYNQLTVQLADRAHLSGVELAHLLALVNVSLADAAMSVWDSKYHYDFWRPVTGIRESDVGTGPTGRGDGNPSTVGDPGFMPLGAPASNLTGPNFTPPFPTYPSGHAGFGGALFQVLRRYFGTDRFPFIFVSDEFNGTTYDANGNLRPYLPRFFRSFSEAEMENGRSRVYLGIHWNFDSTEGIALGRRVGDYVYDHVYPPARR